MSSLFHFLFGTCVLSFPADKKTEVLSILLSEGIGAISCTVDGEEGRITLFCRDAVKMPRSLCTPLAEYGLRASFSALVRRPGLIVGFILAILLLVISSMTVWRVEVVGNDRIGDVEIESAMAAVGLAVGDISAGLDLSAIKNRFLEENPEISWVGIYIRGTTARIEVREATDIGESDGAEGFCNLVATADGVIERISVDAGRAAVLQGMTVRAGELLISGIYRTATGLRATRAKGCVLARSETTLTVLQCFNVEEKEYLDGVIDEIFLEFFGKKIKLLKNSSKNAAEYDIIKRKEQIVLLGGIALPIYIERYERIPYTVRAVTLTEEEAVRMAFGRLRAEMAARFSEAEIVAEQVYAEWTEDGYRLTCRVEYIADIATPLAYDVEMNGG